ncbi:MAG: response regulator transcription factor [Oscillospiraceae bacterium]
MAAKAKICVVEDDNSIRLLLEMSLKSAGYEVMAFNNADDALAQMKINCPDAALLDVMMEGIDGIEAMRIIRSDKALENMPVMMLTAKDSETDKVTGLDAGADDYMTKPFSVLELCARVRALLRRVRDTDETSKAAKCIMSEDLSVDLSTREATLKGEVIDLTYKEFELLTTLMQNAPRALSRDELLQLVWGFDFVGETRTLDMHIGTLRAKLGEDTAKPKYIKTVRGVGYRFTCEVH